MLAHASIYSSVRRHGLKAAVDFRSPRIAAPPGHTAPRTMTRAGGSWFPSVCMANRVRTASRHGPPTIYA
ncbi:hypothetical protein SCATT_31340 [Streptantibioticus cattleyicolor NRRL 8057 = DSM 46488]|uniref:Uncharacterized protein n=1 Tax=Streptantibioticus cattleyicolor (strain ATCC 35852 / DSM 46488 / JCM 4925 / NBRC 14057 / NRRL 8057) TaxID=1003195 RepID=G8WWZ0_STREN|nr:hypothetical protein SCATT_31340 [Streptantibioticus cattleyicolor NRRL 8057 = DSM 46488]